LIEKKKQKTGNDERGQEKATRLSQNFFEGNPLTEASVLNSLHKEAIEGS
jgi:hypothetical protein